MVFLYLWESGYLRKRVKQKKFFFKNIWEFFSGRGNQYATKHEPLTLWGFLNEIVDTSEKEA